MTVRNVISRGELSAIYLGQRRVRIRRSELDRFLAAGETGRNKPEHKQSDLDGAMANVLRAQDSTEMVAALRTLAAAAERLADSLERVPAE
jgi:excisionase family DNA binding protein